MTVPRDPHAPAAPPTPDLDRLDAALARAGRVFRGVVPRLRAELGPAWSSRADETVRRLFPGDPELEAAAQGYVRFALDVLRRQLRFEKERAYEAKTYAEAAREVYANPEYMRSQYLPGLLLSHHLWPHHHRQHEFFERVFLEELRRAGARRCYDVGVGTGFYTRSALTGVEGLQVVAFDVSPSSREFTEWHVGAFGAGDRLTTELRDVVAEPPDPVDWLVSVEVLEHLEDPVTFLRALRRAVTGAGKAFITTALNAPNADHIYLYRTAAEVGEQLTAAGFAVEQYFCAAAGKPAFAGAPVAEVAAFVVT